MKRMVASTNVLTNVGKTGKTKSPSASAMSKDIKGLS